jgi:hypothetical protein
MKHPLFAVGRSLSFNCALFHHWILIISATPVGVRPSTVSTFALHFAALEDSKTALLAMIGCKHGDTRSAKRQISTLLSTHVLLSITRA